MNDFQLTTPVVFIIFNRPDTTARVFEVIRQVKPFKLFVVADGSRDDKPGEAEKCATARAIIEQVDWECEIIKNYSEMNLGCAKRIASGLNWVFNCVEEAIILEDDCLPHQTFFRFCEELLDKYKHDNRITSISGQNVQFGRRCTEYSYYFSRYQHCWGWATWKRAWQYFDFDMNLWSEIKDKKLLNDILFDARAINFWNHIFQETYNGCIDSWANRWMFANWIHGGNSILSNRNLVSNIGFNQEGTHTLNRKSKYSNIPTEEMLFPLRHPPFMIRNLQADKFTQNTLYHAGLYKQMKWHLKKVLKAVI